MALSKLVSRNYGGKPLVSIRYQIIHSFKEGLILLCQSILETRRITHLHGSSHFTMSLRMLSLKELKLVELRVAGSSLLQSIMVDGKKVFLKKLCFIFIKGILLVLLVL